MEENKIIKSYHDKGQDILTIITAVILLFLTAFYPSAVSASQESSDERGKISGQVLDENGLPLTGSVYVSKAKGKSLAFLDIFGEADSFATRIDDDGHFVVKDIAVTGDLTVKFGLQNINNFIVERVHLATGQSIDHFDLKVRYSVKGTLIDKVKQAPLKETILRLYKKEKGQAIERLTFKPKSTGGFVFANLDGSYYIYAESKFTPLLDIIPLNITKEQRKELMIPLENQSKEVMRQKFPAVFYSMDMMKKELENFMMTGECLGDPSGLHDFPLTLAPYGDISSVPLLLDYLRAIDKKYPINEDGIMICTYDHCLEALQIVTKENPGRSLTAWEKWWQKKSAEGNL